MRKTIIAGNWKMNKDVNEAIQFADGLKRNFSNKNKSTVLICAPYTHIFAINHILKDTDILIGAQNMYQEEKGAFTGEISAEMIKSVGCKYVLIGHSERREYFKESNELLNKKIKLALHYELTPIYCVGEKLEHRENNQTFNIIESQIKEGLKGFSTEELKKIVIAYEPVWAIGTGKTASPEQANEVHSFIRSLLMSLSNSDISESISILYGGSVTPDNVTELMKKHDIDGALIGGASLKVDSFLKLINY
ncbi:MAG: triose-phosphate isomerase [Candidatus Margulisbacteria bacterium GWF2_35_9]|nr:MAG: triose-phosphate isomerase [Candidatus Margulisbacteria bacterium GWF2_35_9]